MAESRVVDTNVLVVASVASDSKLFQPDATPIQESELRQRVLTWLQAFEGDPERHAVLDWDWHICREYQGNLSDQDYGWLAMMSKKDKNQVVWVGIEVDQDGNAILDPTLQSAVGDRDDRKMVAATLAAQAESDCCKLTVACDTDWIDCEDALAGAGIGVEHLLEEWVRAKWQAKHGA